MTLASVVTRVVGPTVARACFAASCGVSGVLGGASVRLPSRWAGTASFVTAFVLLSQSQAVLPFRMKSLSPICTGAASRSCPGPPYQTLRVCDPANSDVSDVGFSFPGSCGMPSEAVSTTVPVRGGGAVWSPATAASNCAGVRSGSAGAACATVIAETVATTATTATAPAGTAHRPRRENLSMADMTHLRCIRSYLPVLCRPAAVVSL